MWRFNCAQLSGQKTTKGFTNMAHIRRGFHESVQHWWCCAAATVIIIALLHNNQIVSAQYITNTTLLTAPTQHYRGNKYTIDDLIYGKFSSKVSNDIDMDPCKASTYILNTNEIPAKKNKTNLVEFFIWFCNYFFFLYGF